MSKKGNNRLIRLVRLLRSLPPDRFAYSSYVGSSWKGKPDLSCGTTACAMGWAATMPEFRALGMRLHTRQFGRNVVDPEKIEQDGRKFFDLTYDEFHGLFCKFGQRNVWGDTPFVDASAREVANHIVRFVKWRRAQ